VQGERADEHRRQRELQHERRHVERSSSRIAQRVVLLPGEYNRATERYLPVATPAVVFCEAGFGPPLLFASPVLMRRVIPARTGADDGSARAAMRAILATGARIDRAVWSEATRRNKLAEESRMSFDCSSRWCSWRSVRFRPRSAIRGIPETRERARIQRFGATTGRKGSGGEGGIRTPDTGVSPYNGLANRRLQPLGHLSVRCNRRDFQQFTTLYSRALPFCRWPSSA
jgi:hypothetical protein